MTQILLSAAKLRVAKGREINTAVSIYNPEFDLMNVLYRATYCTGLMLLFHLI